MELLQGRDGLPGRDGLGGPPGPPGPQGKEGQPGPKSGGTIYTRWGRSSCPTSKGAELVYSGYAGGYMITEEEGLAISVYQKILSTAQI